MMKVKIENGSQITEIQLDQKTTVAEALKGAGVNLNLPCGGKQTCGKCMVLASGALSPVGETEKNLLKKSSYSGKEALDLRLACATVIEGDVFIRKLNMQKDDVIITSRKSYKAMGDRVGKNALGIAVDIGTTTVVASLFSLYSGENVGTVAEMNQQNSFGGDLLSRIQYSNDHGFEPVHRVLVDQISSMFSRLLVGLDSQQVKDIVITGNTVMLHYVAGLNPQGIGVYPFTPESLFGEERKANSIFDMFSDECGLYLPPSIDAYVGGDISCGILASNLAEGDGNSILIDVGTNGEMVISNGGELYSCSTAAGPAFEGAEIDMGMTASSGAIDKAIISGGEVSYTTIAGGEAVGICGSGLISAISEMVTSGIISESGELLDEDHDYLGRIKLLEDDSKVFYLNDNVYISQRDIRKIQLAKSAIGAGVRTLIHEIGMEIDKIDNLYIAGGFGSYIDMSAACNIGLFPKELLDRAHSLGNTAEQGAAIMLFEPETRRQIEAVVKKAKAISLSASPYFMDQYMEGMMF